MARSGEKAALALIRPVGRLAGGDEFTLYALAVRDVAYCGRDQHPIAIADWAQADLDRKLGTVATSAEELKADPHGSYAAVDDEAFMVCHMASTETLRHQTLDALASQILRSISEKSANLLIAKNNIPGLVDDDYGIRRRLQGAADQFGRQHQRMTGPVFEALPTPERNVHTANVTLATPAHLRP